MVITLMGGTCQLKKGNADIEQNYTFGVYWENNKLLFSSIARNFFHKAANMHELFHI
jgi:hypothetical protein